MSGASDKENVQEMLRLAAGGDESAWRSIIELYSRRVFGLLRSQCGSAELAEEIAQSTFCTVLTKIGEYTELGRFEAWLFRIAMNRLRDEMRRRKRQARPVESEALAGLAGAGTRHREEPSDPALVLELERALARLPEADRRIIHLRHVAELSFRQIADLLDEPLGTVLARQHRALKKLREAMRSRIEE